jgi:hypothetical protein
MLAEGSQANPDRTSWKMPMALECPVIAPNPVDAPIGDSGLNEAAMGDPGAVGAVSVAEYNRVMDDAVRRYGLDFVRRVAERLLWTPGLHLIEIRNIGEKRKTVRMGAMKRE